MSHIRETIYGLYKGEFVGDGIMKLPELSKERETYLENNCQSDSWKREGPKHSHLTGNNGLQTFPVRVPLFKSQIPERGYVRSGASPLDCEQWHQTIDNGNGVHLIPQGIC